MWGAGGNGCEGLSAVRGTAGSDTHERAGVGGSGRGEGSDGAMDVDGMGDGEGGPGQLRAGVLDLRAGESLCVNCDAGAAASRVSFAHHEEDVQQEVRYRGPVQGL